MEFSIVQGSSRSITASSSQKSGRKAGCPVNHGQKQQQPLLWSIQILSARITMSIASLSSSVKISSAAVAANVTMSSVIGATLCSLREDPLLSFRDQYHEQQPNLPKRKT